MQKFTRVSLILLAIALLWLSGQMVGTQTPAAMPPGRVSPWVLEATAGGAQTDFLVVLTEQADLSPARALPTKQAKGRFVYEALWETAQRSQAPLRAWLDARQVPYRAYYIVNLIHVQAGDRALVEALSARPDVARLEANPHIQNALPQPMFPEIPVSPTAIEWNITKVGAPDVWAMGYTGQGVVVGGQDTGYDWDHPALVNQYRGGPGGNHDYNWHDAIHSGGGSCGADSPEPCDDSGHGTHTMGTVLGDDGSANQIGMAPGAQWIGCRNMNVGYGTPATYLECFEFFLAPYPVGGNPGQGNPDLAPDVTNNSWGCPPLEGCSWSTLQAAVEAQRAAGIMTVVSAGNGGSGCSTVDDPPAIYDASYSVGATNSSDAIASFSSRGPVTVDGSGRLKPDISAPGVSIRSSVPGGGYQGGWQGTSMAAPHVAGAVALVWSAQPALRNQIDPTEDILNPTAVDRYSTQCGDPPNTVPNNVYGWGRLDVLAAVVEALSGDLAGTVSAAGGALIVGADVEATLNPTWTWTTTSGGGGLYSLTVLSGTYTATATAPGYMLYVTTGVTVTVGNTTTLNIILEVTPSYVISGFVREATTGLPLTATVSLPGSPLTPAQTDPASGYYSLTATMGDYELRAEAPYYVPQSRFIVLDGHRTENFHLPRACLLVVDDDGGAAFETYYTDALDRLGFAYNLRTAATLDWLTPYQGVVWLTGNQWSATLTAADRANLAAYLDGGGRLFLSGQYIGFDIGASDFYRDYLHAALDSDDVNAHDLAGLDFMVGLDITIQGGDGANNQLHPSDNEPVNGGLAVYDYAAPYLYGGVAYSGTHRTVYYSFGYEAIDSQVDREAVMSATLAYLGVCGTPEAPQAGFVSSSPDDWGQTTVFTNTTRGTAWMTYTWDFGDGTARSAEANPSHLYAQLGDYTVVLTATSRYGSSVYSDTVQIESGGPCDPVSQVQLDRTPAGDLFVGDEVHFVAHAEGTIPFAFAWAVDSASVGGNSSTLDYTFLTTGTHTVSVTVTNSCGQGQATMVVVLQKPEVGQPDLSGSYKMVNLANVESGDVLSYTIFLHNASSVTATATLTDLLPAHTTYVTDSALANAGQVTFANGQLLWSGQIISGTPVLVQFAAEVQDAPIGTQVANAAQLDDGAGQVTVLTAQSIYNPGYRMTINDGALYTNIPTVTLHFWWDANDNISQRNIGNDGGFVPGAGTSGWLAATEVYSGWGMAVYGDWRMPRTVYAMHRDDSGQQYGPVQDDIIYDPVPPQVSHVEIITQTATRLGALVGGGQEVMVRVTASDDNSGVSRVQLSDSADLSQYAEFDFPGGTNTLTIQSWPLPSSGEVHVRAVDRAGNVSAAEYEQGPVSLQIYLPLVVKN